jgi:DNA modification methylase
MTNPSEFQTPQPVDELINKIILGDNRETLKTIPSGIAHTCVTSPPYFGLRNYGVNGQLGLEQTPEEYITKMVEVFREVKRILRNDGTLWLNIGDSYAGSGKGSATHLANNEQWKQGTNKGSHNKTIRNYKSDCIKPKDLIGIPWMLAFALRADGWYLRQDIIWNKPNPMPESVTDRCTKSHEYIFLLSKQPKYFYDIDAIRIPVKDSTVQKIKACGPGRTPRSGIDSRGGNQGSTHGIKAYSHRGTGDKKLTGHSGNFDADGNLIGGGMANKKSVWTVTTKPTKDNHFASYPEDLISDCIKAGSSERGCCSICGSPWIRVIEKEYKVHEKWYGERQSVRNSRGKAGNAYHEVVGLKTLDWKPTCECASEIMPSVIFDPFMGTGTTAVVARKLNRNFIGCEVNPEYIDIAEKKLRRAMGIFL